MMSVRMRHIKNLKRWARIAKQKIHVYDTEQIMSDKEWRMFFKRQRNAILKLREH